MSIFPNWEYNKIFRQELAFMRTAFNLCIIVYDLLQLNRIQSPTEFPPITS